MSVGSSNHHSQSVWPLSLWPLRIRKTFYHSPHTQSGPDTTMLRAANLSCEKAVFLSLKMRMSKSATQDTDLGFSPNPPDCIIMPSFRSRKSWCTQFPKESCGTRFCWVTELTFQGEYLSPLASSSSDRINWEVGSASSVTSAPVTS